MSVPPPSAPAQIESWEVLDLLTSLVQKSLVVYDEDDQGRGRYRLLETVRQYARDRLAESGEGEAVRCRHFEVCLARSRAFRSQFGGADQVASLDRLETEHENVRAALTWSMESGNDPLGLRLATTVWHFWRLRGYWREGWDWLTRLATRTEALGETPERATALTAAGALAWHCGDFPLARQLLQASVPIFRKTEDPYSLAWALINLGVVESEPAAARSCWEESVALCRAIGEPELIIHPLRFLGGLAYYEDNDEAARSWWEATLAACEQNAEHPNHAASAVWLRALLMRMEGRHADAAELYRQALALFERLGDRHFVGAQLAGLAEAERSLGRHAEAARLSRASLRLARESGSSVWKACGLLGMAAQFAAAGPPEVAVRLFAAADPHFALFPHYPYIRRADRTRHLPALRAALREERFAAAWAAGRAMSLEDAVAVALSGWEALDQDGA